MTRMPKIKKNKFGNMRHFFENFKNIKYRIDRTLTRNQLYSLLITII